MQTHLMPSELASHRKISDTAKSLEGKHHAVLGVRRVGFKPAASPVAVRGGRFLDFTHVDSILLFLSILVGGHSTSTAQHRPRNRLWWPILAHVLPTREDVSRLIRVMLTDVFNMMSSFSSHSIDNVAQTAALYASGSSGSAPVSVSSSFSGF